MAKYIKKPKRIEAITFGEFIDYGLKHTTNIVNGMPWSFDYYRCPVTHESDNFYIITTPQGSYSFTPLDVLIIDNGEIHTFPRDSFFKEYEEVR